MSAADRIRENPEQIQALYSRAFALSKAHQARATTQSADRSMHEATYRVIDLLVGGMVTAREGEAEAMMLVGEILSVVPTSEVLGASASVGDTVAYIKRAIEERDTMRTLVKRLLKSFDEGDAVGGPLVMQQLMEIAGAKP